MERVGRLFPSQALIARLHAAAPGSSALHMAYALELRGPLDVDALDAAFSATLERHDALRTAFEPDGRGGFRGRVRARIPWALERVDLSTFGPTEALALSAEHARASANAPFRIEEGQSLRASLLTLAPQSHILLVAFHHIVADGWSLEVFGRELTTLYAARRAGAVPRIEALSTQPFDCVDRYEAWLATEPAMRRLEFWRSHYEDVDAPSATLPNAPEDTLHLPMHRLVSPLSETIVTALAAAAKRTDTTFFGALLTALAVVLARWTSCEQAAIGTLVANRMTVAATKIMSPLYDGVLFLARLRGGAALRETLAVVGAQWMNALEHQGITFEDIAETAAVDLGVSPSRLPTFMLQLDRHPLHALRLEGTTVTPLHLEDAQPPAAVAATTSASCVFFVREHDGRATLSVLHKPEVLGEEAARTLTAAFLAVLEALAVDSTAPWTDLALTLPDWPPIGDPAAPRGGGHSGRPAALVRSVEVCPVDALSPVIAGFSVPSGGVPTPGGPPCT